MTAAAALVLVLAAAPVARDPDGAALRRSIDRILDAPVFAGAFWAAEVRSLQGDRILYERNARKNMTPASTLKLLTTAAALDAFGPELRLRTSLESAGRLDASGRILGDLYLVGRGDPLLARPGSDGRTGFDVLAESLRAAGVKRIEGRLIGHEGLFQDRRGTDWEWSDLVWCYGAEVSALSWNENCALLSVVPGEQPGDPVAVERSPESRYYAVQSRATTSAPGGQSELVLERELGSALFRISGTHPQGAAPEELRVALEDPALYATTVFEEALAARGIRVASGVGTSAAPLPAGLRVLAVHDSPPLAEILQEANKPSQNLYTEMLQRLLGARSGGVGSLTAGREALRAFLKRLGIGDGSSLEDGSGLSRTDLVTAHDLVGLLVAMHRHPHGQAFRDSLAVAGVDGTLENRMKGGAAFGRVVAKTGSLKHTNALAGYVKARDGAWLAFAIIVNHNTAPSREATNAIDAVAGMLAGR